jgi:hypothetical protein
MRTATGVIAVLLTILCVSSASAGGSTSPGKNSVYASADAPAGGTYSTAVTGTIEKGKKKTVIEIDVMATSIYPAGGGIIVLAKVNDLHPEPIIQALDHCAEGVLCTVSGQWWLDVDAAEMLMPGKFVGQPLVIDGQVAASGGITDARVSLRARVRKK